MDSTGGNGKLNMKAKVTLRLRQKVTLTEPEIEQTNKPATAKTSFNLHKRMSPDPDEKRCKINTHKLSSPEQYNKYWSSKSVPTSPTHVTNTRIYPSSTSDWRKHSLPSDESSSVASSDSAFGSDTSPCGSVKSWHPGMNYKPTHPIYSMPAQHSNVFYSSSSRGSESSGGSVTPTPGSPSGEHAFPFGGEHSRSSFHKIINESAAQTQLNIEPKKFTEQDKQMLEGFFPASTKSSGLKGKNFINSAVFKESKKSGEAVQNLEQPRLQMKYTPVSYPSTPPQDRRMFASKHVLVFPENSPGKILPKSSNPRVSLLVKHFNSPTSPQASPKPPRSNKTPNSPSPDERDIPARPASAGRLATHSIPPTKAADTEETSHNDTRGMSESCDMIRSKPYETDMFKDSSRRQSFLDNYLVRLQRNSTNTHLLSDNNSEMKRGSSLSGSGMDLSQMRPLSTSAIFVKQDSFTNDPYKRKSFLDKYLSRQGQTQFIGKKTL